MNAGRTLCSVFTVWISQEIVRNVNLDLIIYEVGV